MTDFMFAHSTLVAMVIIALLCRVIAALAPEPPALRPVPVRARRGSSLPRR